MTKHREPLPERPPSFLSRASLAAELDCSIEMIEDLVLANNIPRPVTVRGREVWNWKAVEASLNGLAAWGTIYVIGFAAYVKIGFTEGSVDVRRASLQTACPEVLEIIATVEGRITLEREVHKRFAEYRLQGEWFRRDGRLSEWIDRGCPP